MGLVKLILMNKGDYMIESIHAQLNDWKYGRTIVKIFLQELSDKDLDKKLQRNGLDTIRKQILELLSIQEDYIIGILRKEMIFRPVNLENIDKNEMLEKMNQLDKNLEDSLKDIRGDEVIQCYGEEQNIHGHISEMIGHEQMHIGQIVAFYYSNNIEIPNRIVRSMALDG